MAALKILYEWEVGGEDLEQVLDSWRNTRPYLLDDGAEAIWETFDAELWGLAEHLVRSTAEGLARVDPLIERRAEHWRLARMPIIDRLILRMAIAELIADPATPRAVVINEALELARAFSAEAAVGFINGVLDGVARDLVSSDRAPEAGPRE